MGLFLRGKKAFTPSSLRRAGQACLQASSATGQAHNGGKPVPLAKLVRLGLPGALVLSQRHRLTLCVGEDRRRLD